MPGACRSKAASEGYDHCISVIGQSYGHVFNTHSKQIAKLTENMAKMRRVEAQVAAHARQASRMLLDEAVGAAQRGDYAEAHELLTMANRARPWADLKPVALDDIAALDPVRPRPPRVKFPVVARTTTSDSSSSSSKNNKKLYMAARTARASRVVVVPLGSVVRLVALAAPDEEDEEEARRSPCGNPMFRIQYHDGAQHPQQQQQQQHHHHHHQQQQPWRPWPTATLADGGGGGGGSGGEEEGMVVRRPGRATLEVQYQPATEADGLASLVDTHELEVVLPGGHIGTSYVQKNKT